MINIAFVDDEVLIGKLLSNHFNDEPDITVCYAGTNGTDFLAFVETAEQNIDVAIIDLKLNEESGIDLTKKLKEISPNTKVIIISSHYKLSFLGFILKNGSDAFLPKGITPQQLHKVILHVAEHGYYFTTEQVGILKKQVKSNPPETHFYSEKLTDREKDVLLCICQQLSAKETAEKLFISPKTVEGHKGNLLLKTGTKNSAGLVVYAMKHQLFDPIEFGNI
jgi:DNA-binding NarL/FixJ family response regulator